MIGRICWKEPYLFYLSVPDHSTPLQKKVILFNRTEKHVI